LAGVGDEHLARFFHDNMSELVHGARRRGSPTQTIADSSIR
jgi:hypothetical protein